MYLLIPEILTVQNLCGTGYPKYVWVQRRSSPLCIGILQHFFLEKWRTMCSEDLPSLARFKWVQKRGRHHLKGFRVALISIAVMSSTSLTLTLIILHAHWNVPTTVKSESNKAMPISLQAYSYYSNMAIYHIILQYSCKKKKLRYKAMHILTGISTVTFFECALFFSDEIEEENAIQ